MITVVFPGQGAQKTGMCKDFYEASQIVKDTFKDASDALGYSMEDLCFTENEKLNLTEYTQPALLTCEVAMWRYLVDRGFKADYFAGHSLGEYSALVAAGVMRFADGVKIVRRRGELMQRAVPVGEGAMKVINFPIGFPKDESEASIFPAIKKWCNQYDVDVANLNSPRQLVISGPAKAVEWLADANTGFIRGSLMMGDYIDIPVSAPFHSRAMRVIEDEFKTFINGFDFNFDNVVSVYSNKTGVLHTREDFVKNLVGQISSPVDWIGNMVRINSHGGEVVEIGPGKPLSGFFKSLNTPVTSIMIMRQADTLLKAKGL